MIKSARPKQRAKIHPIVTEIDEETQTSKYYSLIIVPADSLVQSTAELKGKVFAFGDVSSTSGSLYPRFMLDKAGCVSITKCLYN